jgi:hypothetical protein
MSTSSVKPTVSLINDEWKTFGISIHEKRLVFQDPHGQILNHQVKRWRPEKNQVAPKDDKGEKGLISGIKVHSKAIHIFWKIIYYISFGRINKSITVVLDNKRIHLSTDSLQKWRRLNHEALLSLGILKPATRKDLAKVRQEELTALNDLLKLLPKDRPQRKKTIVECGDSFELCEAALQLARAKLSANNFPNVDQEIQGKAMYAIAAFYILLTSEIIVPACGEEMLQVATRLTVKNFAASEEELARLVNAGHENLENQVNELEKIRKELEMRHLDASLAKKEENKAREDLVLFETIRVAYEDTQEDIKCRYLNKTPDLFSSLQTRNNPVQAKKLLNELLKTNEKFAFSFTSNLLNFLIKGKGSIGSTSQEKEFFQHIMSLGKAMKDQFTPQDPGAPLKYMLQSSFVQITSIITEDNQVSEQLLNQIGTLTAWELLQSSPTVITHSDYSKTLTCVIEEPRTLSIHFPPQNLYDKQECIKISPLPFVNALAGKLRCDEQSSPICYTEALDFVRDYKELFSEEVIVLRALVNRMALNPLENEQGHQPPETILAELWNELAPNQKHPSELTKNFLNARQERLSEYEDFSSSAYDKEAFDQLAALYGKLAKLGELIRYRYLSRYMNEFLDKIDFESNGKIKINPELFEVGTVQVIRTAEEHKKMIKTYFPDYTIPQLPKKEPPKFQPREHLKMQPRQYRDYFFNSLPNYSGDSGINGSCCVGALAQGIFKSEAASGKRTYLVAIRNAASNYMKRHPEQFFECGLFDDSQHSYTDRKYKELVRQKNLSDAQKRELNQLQIAKVEEYANAITREEYFNLAALKAVSLIIGRPIYVLETASGNTPYKLDAGGHIQMEKINPQLDGEILYLDLADSLHYHCLMPKRVGIQNI